MTSIFPELSFSSMSATDWLGALLIAALAFILGFALNRGSICTVIATADWVLRKRPARSIALLESALWAGVVYAILDVAPFMPAGWLPIEYLLAGAILFALGSYVNGACVFGSIGHIGNGDIQVSLVFVGIFLVTFVEPIAKLLPEHPPLSLPLLGGAMLFVGLIIVVVGIRFFLARRDRANFRVLTVSMGLIGVSFATLASVAPLFSITASIEAVVSVPVAGAVAVMGMSLGSIASSLLRNRAFRFKLPTWGGMLRHLTGGILMGLGAVLIPGGNDTLLLTGFPGAAWQALLAYVVIVGVLAALIAGFGSKAMAWGD
ncbi:YeeE/YedE thiosulfate transporter family protein [Paracoccus sp. MKU1]|jgi:uncharacterized membrane protein YedE/YeeE|uniref:YeeE/YedE thiosulfate transporter family protein n=1 Tax=Paracoccus sp. MKU1 TaxID=1745182 RepID=UPI000719300F|nr:MULTISPECIES: YeeE/YedE thiosulfate transporter family protein [Alphaproteobacteria]KRW97492.1 hypothetical protein AQY21_03460 [Paracoccus sp. MKU1]